MQLYIPVISTELVLLHPWSFTLFQESRNSNFIQKLIGAGIITEPEIIDRWKVIPIARVTLPIGAKLTVRRIYIRQGKEQFNSVTFAIQFKHKGSKKITGRFWAKATDVNIMEIVAPAHISEPSPLCTTNDVVLDF